MPTPSPIIVVMLSTKTDIGVYVREQPDDRERHGDREHADDQRQRRRHQRAEGEHQDDQRERQEPLLARGAVLASTTVRTSRSSGARPVTCAR